MNISSPFVSIIVPVYNASAFLSKCIDSLLNQTLKETEIILVDDASSDASPQIIKNYRQKHPGKIKALFFENNSRQGAARNAGLRLATGEYVSYVDSDDVIAPYFLQTLHNAAITNPGQIIRCLNTRFSEKNPPEFSAEKESPVLQKLDVLQSIKIGSGACGMLIPRNILDRSEHFPENLLAEDALFTAALYCQSGGILLMREKLYGYRMSHSASTTANPKRAEDISHVLRMMAKSKKICEDAFLFTAFVLIFNILRSNLTSVLDAKKQAAEFLGKFSYPFVTEKIRTAKEENVSRALNALDGKDRKYSESLYKFIKGNGGLFFFRKSILARKTKGRK